MVLCRSKAATGQRVFGRDESKHGCQPLPPQDGKRPFLSLQLRCACLTFLRHTPPLAELSVPSYPRLSDKQSFVFMFVSQSSQLHPGYILYNLCLFILVSGFYCSRFPPFLIFQFLWRKTVKINDTPRTFSLVVISFTSSYCAQLQDVGSRKASEIFQSKSFLSHL